MAARRHKAFVVTTDPTWRAFKALTVEHSTTIELELGRLVEREVRSARRDRQRSAGRSAVAQREIAKLTGRR